MRTASMRPFGGNFIPAVSCSLSPFGFPLWLLHRFSFFSCVRDWSAAATAGRADTTCTKIVLGYARSAGKRAMFGRRLLRMMEGNVTVTSPAARPAARTRLRLLTRVADNAPPARAAQDRAAFRDTGSDVRAPG